MTLALLGALIIGMSLGLLGSGGSILTIPVLVFILQRPEKLAIAESLAIVGSIAFMGSIPYGARRQIHWKSVFFFGCPGVLGAYLGAYCSYYISGSLQLILFTFILFLVAWIMIFGHLPINQVPTSHPSIWRTVGQGLLIGLLTGFLGIGGGFLIVPALVFLGHLSMSFAIGTSLIIIAMNCCTGFIVQWLVLNHLHLQVNWTVIGVISAVGILGSLLGSILSKKIPQVYLKQFFGLSIFLMGIYIFIRQL